MLQAITIPAKQAHTATVIFLHGLGDSGFGWAPVGEMLADSLPSVKWIFPHAPNIPITLNGGMKMPGWYDIYDLNDRAKEDEEGMLKTVIEINDLIRKESNVKVILGGFSQGSAISLLTGTTTMQPLAGIIALSGYIPLRDKINQMMSETNKNTKILMAHGTHDPVVSFEWGKASFERLKSLNRNVDFKAYHGMQHSTCPKELEDLKIFIKSCLQ